MNHPNPRTRGIALAGLAALAGLILGCGAQEASLPGAVYAAQVPVYPAATYESSMGGSSSYSIGGPATSESTSWFFKTSDSMAKVVEFYQARLSGARRETTDRGEVSFHLDPAGASDGEYVEVIVRPGTIQIHESVSPGKKTGDSAL